MPLKIFVEDFEREQKARLQDQRASEATRQQQQRQGKTVTWRDQVVSPANETAKLDKGLMVEPTEESDGRQGRHLQGEQDSNATRQQQQQQVAIPASIESKRHRHTKSLLTTWNRLTEIILPMTTS
jgi:hypothetical protein